MDTKLNTNIAILLTILIIFIDILLVVSYNKTSKHIYYDCSYSDNIIKSKEKYNNAYFRYIISLNGRKDIEIIVKNSSDFNIGDKVKLDIKHESHQ